jgi:N-acetylmuramoyl-L-alanine amidase
MIDVNLKFGNLTKRKSTDTIFIHHAVYNGTVQGIHQMHLNKGWSGIGYHYYVRKDGSIYIGRPDDVIGAHAYGFNNTSIGICFEGNFETDIMSEAQIKAGQKIVSLMKEKYNVKVVKGHKEVNATACPR